MQAAAGVPDVLVSDALAAWSRGERAHAAALMADAARAGADSAPYHMLRGVQCREAGDLPGALAAYRVAIARDPALAEAWFNLANVLAMSGQHEAAVAAYEATVARAPAAFQAWNALGSAHTALHAYGRAIAVLEHTTQLAPDFAEGWNNLGRALWQAGEAQAAIAAIRRAVALAPDRAGFHSNLLTVLHYDPTLDGAAIAAEHRAWATRHAPAGRPFADPRDRMLQRRLRVGYVSSNLRHDAAGVFIASALLHHDPAAFDLVAYSEAADADALTARMRAAVPHWVESWGMDDAAFAARVRADAIDVLVDLNGHTGRGRLAAFARRCAPVQLSWLGYEGATGVPAMDGLIADANVAPEGEALPGMEPVLRLPFSFQCWTPPESAPAPVPRGEGGLTFGCFNKPAKLNAGVLALWGELLRAVPAARLLLKSAAYADARPRERILAALAAQGVEAGRVVFRGASPYTAMLAEYGEVDVALDPFPFSGGATSCDALWMGVPVVTLRGTRFSANHTVSHLSAGGFPEWIADTPADYVRVAAGLMHDAALRAELRHALRPALAVSPLCNGPLLARQLERLYRAAWRRWCEGGAERGAP